MKLEKGQLVYGRLNSVLKVIEVDYFESKNHFCERYILKPQSNYCGSVVTLRVVPSDIGKLVFTEKRTEDQLERYYDYMDKNYIYDEF